MCFRVFRKKDTKKDPTAEAIRVFRFLLSNDSRLPMELECYLMMFPSRTLSARVVFHKGGTA